jgi:hypothetical protein
LVNPELELSQRIDKGEIYNKKFSLLLSYMALSGLFVIAVIPLDDKSAIFFVTGVLGFIALLVLILNIGAARKKCVIYVDAYNKIDKRREDEFNKCGPWIKWNKLFKKPGTSLDNFFI